MEKARNQRDSETIHFHPFSAHFYSTLSHFFIGKFIWPKRTTTFRFLYFIGGSFEVTFMTFKHPTSRVVSSTIQRNRIFFRRRMKWRRVSRRRGNDEPADTSFNFLMSETPLESSGSTVQLPLRLDDRAPVRLQRTPSTVQRLDSARRGPLCSNRNTKGQGLGCLVPYKQEYLRPQGSCCMQYPRSPSP